MGLLLETALCTLLEIYQYPSLEKPERGCYGLPDRQVVPDNRKKCNPVYCTKLPRGENVIKTDVLNACVCSNQLRAKQPRRASSPRPFLSFCNLGFGTHEFEKLEQRQQKRHLHNFQIFEEARRSRQSGMKSTVSEERADPASIYRKSRGFATHRGCGN